MKPSEAAELVSFLYAAFPSLTDEQRRLYQRLLEAEDADAATQAVLAGIKTWRYTPSYAQIKDAIRAEHLAAKANEPRPPEQKRHLPPDWVWVWRWCRVERNPRELRGFPQQAEYANPLSVLGMDDYKRLLAEWEAAGQPKAFAALPAALRKET